jgi:hypothetical protein
MGVSDEVRRVVLAGFMAVALLCQEAPPAPAARLPATPAPAPDEARGRLTFLVTGSAGVKVFGSLLTAGAGAGWAWRDVTVAVLARYSRLRSDHIVLSDSGERWEEVRALEGALWMTSSPSPRGLFRLAFTAGLGPGRFVFSDFGQVYRRRKLTWSVAGGIGLGPLHLLLGRSEPEIDFQPPGGPRFSVGGATHVSLNLTFDPVAFVRTHW